MSHRAQDLLGRHVDPNLPDRLAILDVTFLGLALFDEGEDTLSGECLGQGTLCEGFRVSCAPQVCCTRRERVWATDDAA